MSDRRTPQQRAAIDSDARDILLSAGAGSGKTSTTVSRYERLLTGEYTDGRVGEGVEPPSILVFTFTDKAAGELRERIRDLRDSRGRDFSMGSLWVGTFHSICARILRAHPIAASVDPAFEVIDDVVASRLKESAWRAGLAKTVGERSAEDGEETIGVLSRFSPLTLKKGVQATYERLRAAGELDPRLPEPRAARPLEEIQRELLREALAVRADSDITPAPKQRAENVIAALEHIEPESLTLDLLESIDIYKQSKAIPDLCKKVAAAKVELISREQGPRYWRVLSTLLTNFGRAYGDAKSRRQGLDFEDLQLRTLELLLRRPEIASSYREQFVEIMVDEFQDTNRLQMDLIDQLRGEATRLFTVGDEMQAIYGFRYADVDLFRQRRTGGSYRLPEQEERRLAGERDEVRFPVENLSLNANFRSQAPVIGAVNEIGRQFEALIEDLRTDDEPGGEIGGTRHEFEELKVGLVPGPESDDAGTGLEPRVEMLLVEAGGWQKADLGPLAPAPGEDQYVTERRGEHEAEALALAWHIRAAVDDGVPPGDIVILLRTKTRMWLFEAALKQVGLRPYVVGGTGFWDTREGVDLRALLGTIANPLDDEALSGTLAGPACGLSPSAMWLLGQDRGDAEPLWPRLRALATDGFDGVDDDDRELAARFVETVDSLRARQPGMSLAELVKGAVAATGYDLVNLMRDPSGAGLANIRRVAEIAGEYEAAEGRDLRGLVDWIDDSSRLDSEQAVATEDEESDVVRLMTVHKSKGLEFPMVCVADLGRDSRSQSESVIWVSPRVDQPGQFDVGLRLPEPEGRTLDLYGWSDLKQKARLETTDEELRIFHVALTRAQRRLVLSGVANLDETPSPSEANPPAARLTQAFGLDGLEDGIPVPAPASPQGTELSFPDGLIEVTLIRGDDAEGLGNELSPDSGTKADAVGGRPPLSRPRLGAFPSVPLSYSALNAYRECPARFFASRVLKLDGPTQPSGRTAAPLDPEMNRREPDDPTAFGRAVHKLLEDLPRRRWLVPGDEQISNELAAYGLGDDEEEVSRARSMLEEFLATELGQMVQQARVDTEADLLIDIDGVIVRGSADLIVRDTRSTLILDYKSNRLDGTSTDELMEKYDLQRDLYALAVAQALGVDELETAFVFLRDPARPVRDRFDGTRISKARASVSGLVEDIAGGRYLGGPDAAHRPCGDCWACELLAGQIEAARFLAEAT